MATAAVALVLAIARETLSPRLIHRPDLIALSIQKRRESQEEMAIKSKKMGAENGAPSSVEISS